MVAPLLAAAIPAGINLLGGLFGRDKTPEPETKYEFGKMRAAAEAAGFNPLTVLKATGGAPTSVSNPVPRLSSAAVIADALGTGAREYFASQPDPLQEARDRLEIDLMRKQLETVTLDPMSRGTVRSTVSTGWSGAPVTAQTVAAPTQNPNPGLSATNYNPSMTGPKTGYNDLSIESRSGVRISNMDADNPPPELEMDAYTIAREGQLVPWGVDLFQRNNVRNSYEDWALERDAPYALKQRWKEDAKRNKRERKRKEYKEADDPLRAARDRRRGTVN